MARVGRSGRVGWCALSAALALACVGGPVVESRVTERSRPTALRPAAWAPARASRLLPRLRGGGDAEAAPADPAAREANVYMAKLAEQAGRYDEMVKATAAIAKMNVDLTVEERSLLSVAYKNAVGARRASWKIISSIEQKEAESDKASIITEYRAKVRTAGGPTKTRTALFVARELADPR